MQHDRSSPTPGLLSDSFTLRPEWAAGAEIEDVGEQDQATDRERQLEALHEVAVASSGVLDPGELAHLVIERARDLLGGDEATLLWFDPSANGLRVIGDTFVRPFNRVIGVGEGTAGIAFETGQPVLVEDYPHWEHAVQDSLPRGLRSVIAVPLVVRTKPVGALTVSFNKPRQFVDDDVRLLLLFATQLAPALEAAHLHGQVVQIGEELKRASEAKSRFLASMSHELRTPLNAILGFSELLMDDTAGVYDAKKRQQFLEQIHRGGKRLLALINDVLDLSKIEAGQMELMPITFDLREAIESTIDSVRPLADRKSITLRVDVPAGSDLQADLEKVRQIVLNLVSNAIKFTPAGGNVSVTVSRGRRESVICVQDTGIGISPGDQSKLFVEFQQVGESRRGGQEGTGLGLALVKRLAELHGGRAWVESELGKGSRFYIALPHAGQPAVAASAPETGTHPLVMVVEDNDSAALLLSTNLTRAGYRVHVVKKGGSVLEQAIKLLPSAITLDILLPDTDGWEVLRSLKATPETRDIPVLVISVLDDRALGLALGADDYMVKPIQRETLLKFVARHGLDRSAHHRLKVLAVDDDPSSLSLIKETFEPEFSVVTAPGGAQALEAARSDRPDLVILDLMMPGMNGFEVAAALKADEKTLDIPILVSTAKDLSQSDKARLNGHVAAVLQKRGGASDLLAWLRSQKLVRAPAQGPEREAGA